MNATQLLAHFERLAEAPEAVPRLRRFILDLAVRGKLVAQDAGEEPAAELLKRIQSERARLVKAGKLKETKALANILGDLPANKLPRNWSWVPFGATVNSHLGGGTPSKANSTYWHGEIPWASVKDVGKSKYLDSTIDRITEAGLVDSSSNLIKPGNLIVVTRMGLGKVSINRVAVAINQDLRAVSLSNLMSIDYCYIYFKTHGFEGSGLTVKGIKIEELLGIAFPLPPLAEQQRIVTKVDELMALCDQLEAAQQERERRRDRLTAASLQRLNQPAADTTPEAQREYARFHLHHLPRLTTRPEHIKAMRQTILNLAVCGRLVYQVLTEGNSTELLRLIDLENRVLKKMKGISAQQLGVLTEGTEPEADIPCTWIRANLQELSYQITDGTHLTPKYTEQGRPFLSAQNVKPFRFIPQKHRFVSLADFHNYRANRKPERGDVLLTRVGAGIGEAAVLDSDLEFAFYVSLCLIKIPTKYLIPEYLVLWLNSPEGRECSTARTYGKGASQGNLNLGQIRTFKIPLPPLAEQHRIVAKVDELMALCDQLEAQLTTTQIDSRRLLEAVLEAALAPA